MKRIFIIRGLGGNRNEIWFPWLKKELKKINLKYYILSMPNTNKPKIKKWIAHIKNKVKKVDNQTMFIGHSLGGLAVLRYLQTLPKNEKIGGVIFIASPMKHINHLSKEEEIIAKPWLENDLYWNKIKNHTKKFVAIFSNNDQYIPINESNFYKNKLKAKIIILKNKGHFIKKDGIKKIPILMSELNRLK